MKLLMAENMKQPQDKGGLRYYTEKQVSAAESDDHGHK